MNKAAFDVSLRHDMFKWTNVIWLSMDLLISSRMDVVIIAAKLVCHLYCVCKLVYFSNANSTIWWCYSSRRFIRWVRISVRSPRGPCPPLRGGKRRTVRQWRTKRCNSSRILRFISNVIWVHRECWWGHSKIYKNDTLKVLQCTRHCTTGLGY